MRLVQSPGVPGRSVKAMPHSATTSLPFSFAYDGDDVSWSELTTVLVQSLWIDWTKLAPIPDTSYMT
jgi:hypothetical protein